MGIGYLTLECCQRQQSCDRDISTEEGVWKYDKWREKGVSRQVVKSEWARSAEVLELYWDRLSKEPVVQRDVREGVRGDVGAEVGGVRDSKWNRVSPDIYHPFKGVASWHGKRCRRAKRDGVKDYSSDAMGCCWVSPVGVYHQFWGMDVIPRFPWVMFHGKPLPLN